VINLLRKKVISGFLRHRLVPGVFQYVTVPLFFCLIFYTLFGPREQNPGNIIAWSLLWPSLLLSVIVSGRGFCAYCPIAAVSNVFAYGRKKFLSFPQLMKKYGVWVGITAFISVFWIEHVAEAFLNARVTGMVFLSISGSAIIATLLFGKRVWCIHICPLGIMLGNLAVLSIMELRANSRVCVWQCENRACLKENNYPMGLHPSSERTRHDCILCFACAKKCNQKSVHLDLLPPHQRVLAMKSWNLSRTTFVVLLTGSVLASQAIRWLSDHRAFTVPAIPEIHFHTYWECFFAGVAITIGFAVLTFLVSKTKIPGAWSRNFVYAGYVYLPLAFFGLFNIYFGQFIFHGNEISRMLAKLLGLGYVTILPQTVSNPSILRVLPPLFALAGGMLSLYFLNRLHDQYHLHSLPYRLHQILIIITCLVFFIIF
jgi:polyferredoxin